jgi:hypothetical protein
MRKIKYLPLSARNIKSDTVISLGLVGAFGLFLAALILTGQTWRIIAYALIALFAGLTLLAIYFWGAMILSGIMDLFSSLHHGTPWSAGVQGELVAQEHDIDPGLELVAAGMLVYRLGEVRPRIHFRKIPLANARSIRPFIVARTGAERPYHFQFTLFDEADVPHFQQDFAFTLKDDPQMVTPPQRIMFNKPKKVIGQRWSLQVRAGVTVITSLRFMFVEGGQIEPTLESSNPLISDYQEPVPDRQQDLLAHLLDQALKMEAMTSTQEIILEDVV